MSFAKRAAGFVLLVTLPASLQAKTIFQCRIGTRLASVSLVGDALTYRFGVPRRPELSIRGGPASGNVSYHRTLYARGELQVLRFRRGDHSYLVHATWSAPSGGASEAFEAGVVVMRGATVLRALQCRPGQGDMREYALFRRLPQEPENPLPER